MDVSGGCERRDEQETFHGGVVVVTACGGIKIISYAKVRLKCGGGKRLGEISLY